MISSFELREPKNAFLYYQSSKLVARIVRIVEINPMPETLTNIEPNQALNDYNILLHSFSLIERAIFLEPNNVDYICEIGYQNVMLSIYIYIESTN